MTLERVFTLFKSTTNYNLGDDGAYGGGVFVKYSFCSKSSRVIRNMTKI